ncbi:MAG: hypothetical protein ABSH51_29695 [Solirubrobacteraceae bacterium]
MSATAATRVLPAAMTADAAPTVTVFVVRLGGLARALDTATSLLPASVSTTVSIAVSEQVASGAPAHEAETLAVVPNTPAWPAPATPTGLVPTTIDTVCTSDTPSTLDAS